jgi:hypothetical protein
MLLHDRGHYCCCHHRLPACSRCLPCLQAGGAPQGNSNAFVASAWALRAQRMVFVNSRGPGCFDFDFYVQVGGQHWG